MGTRAEEATGTIKSVCQYNRGTFVRFSLRLLFLFKRSFEFDANKRKKERKKKKRRTFQERECATKVGSGIRISRDFTVKSEEGERNGGWKQVGQLQLDS